MWRGLGVREEEVGASTRREAATSVTKGGGGGDDRINEASVFSETLDLLGQSVFCWTVWLCGMACR
jgi:hypothetical protein